MVTFKFLMDKFPNTNNAYMPINKGKILKKEARKRIDIIKKAAKSQIQGNEFLFKDFDSAIHYIEAEYMFYTPDLFTKRGTINMRKGDIDGAIKFVQDACCEAMGVDDSAILDLKISQFKSKSEEQVFICIYRLCYLNSRFS